MRAFILLSGKGQKDEFLDWGLVPGPSFSSQLKIRRTILVEASPLGTRAELRLCGDQGSVLLYRSDGPL
jgi:hypothetical protein